MSLIRWRAGKAEDVVIKLPVLGTYSATAPYDCPKSQRILEKWGKRDRISRCLKTLASYAAAAKTVLPKLRQLERDLLAHREAKGLQPQIDQLRSLIADIENATDTAQLRSLSDH